MPVIVSPNYRVKFCLGIPLRKGCIILGLSSMIWAMLYIAVLIESHVYYELKVKKCKRDDSVNIIEDEEEDEKSNITATHNDSLDTDIKSPFLNVVRQEKCLTEDHLSLRRSLFLFVIFNYCIYFLLIFLMFYGVLKKKPRMMYPYLVWSVAQSILGILHLLGLRAFSFFNLLEIILDIYCLLVVASYYSELKEAEDERLGVTVVAVTQTPNEMMVVIPTGLPKDDPPPKYPGFTSMANPAYNPGGSDCAMSVPNPAYSPNETGFFMPSASQVDNTPSPDYRMTNFMQVRQPSNVLMPSNPPSYTSLNAQGVSPPEGAPLFVRPSVPNN